MEEFELEQLRRNPKWALVLDFYHQLTTQSRNQLPSFDGWVPRIQVIPDLTAAELPGIHGKLIAFGFLKFDLVGRDEGVRYQLTPLGKQGIAVTDHSDPNSDEPELSVFQPGESHSSAGTSSAIPTSTY